MKLLNHFANLLGGENWKEQNKEEEDEAGLEVSEEEIEIAIQRLKNKKAAGTDGIRAEMWKNAPSEVNEKLIHQIKDEIRNNRTPRKWRIAKIWPIHKKDDKRNVENYRGISVLNVGYKIYGMDLEQRLVKECEKLKVLKDNQTGFRTGR